MTFFIFNIPVCLTTNGTPIQRHGGFRSRGGYKVNRFLTSRNVFHFNVGETQVFRLGGFLHAESQITGIFHIVENVGVLSSIKNSSIIAQRHKGLFRSVDVGNNTQLEINCRIIRSHDLSCEVDLKDIQSGVYHGQDSIQITESGVVGGVKCTVVVIVHFKSVSISSIFICKTTAVCTSINHRPAIQCVGGTVEVLIRCRNCIATGGHSSHVGRLAGKTANAKRTYAEFIIGAALQACERVGHGIRGLFNIYRSPSVGAGNGILQNPTIVVDTIPSQFNRVVERIGCGKVNRNERTLGKLNIVNAEVIGSQEQEVNGFVLIRSRYFNDVVTRRVVAQNSNFSETVHLGTSVGSHEGSIALHVNYSIGVAFHRNLNRRSHQPLSGRVSHSGSAVKGNILVFPAIRTCCGVETFFIRHLERSTTGGELIVFPRTLVLFIVRIAECHDLHFVVGLVKQTAEGGGSDTADMEVHPIGGANWAETEIPLILVTTRCPGNGRGGREVGGRNVRHHRTNTSGGEFNLIRVEAVVVLAAEGFNANGVSSLLLQTRKSVGVTCNSDNGPLFFASLVFEGIVFSIALPCDGGTIGGDIRNGHTVRCGTSKFVATNCLINKK